MSSLQKITLVPFFSGPGQKPVSSVFKPLQSAPEVDINHSDKLESGDPGLSQDTIDTNQRRARIKHIRLKFYSLPINGFAK